MILQYKSRSYRSPH